MTTPLLIAAAVFVGVAALVAGLVMIVRDRPESRIEDRLQMLTAGVSGANTRDLESEASVLAQPLDDRPGLIELFFERFGNVRLLFDQADVNLTLPRLVLISAVVAVAGGALALALGIHAALMPLAMVLLGLLPTMWLLFRRRRRLKAFGVQLPDALEMIARSLRAGQSLGFGFQLVSTEMPDPISKEFGRVFEEQNLGVSLEESLNDLTDRVPNLDLKFFATAVILQRQTGGDLAEILDKIGVLIRDRFRVWGQVQALTGEGRLSGVVLMALPFVLFAAVYQLNPDYVMLLFNDPMGRKMLIVAVLMQILGAVVIRKIVNIKV